MIYYKISTNNWGNGEELILAAEAHYYSPSQERGLEPRWHIDRETLVWAKKDNVRVSWDSPKLHDFALWQISFHPGNKWNVGFVLINKATGKLAGKEIESSWFAYNAKQVMQASIPSDGVIPDKCIWQINKATVKWEDKSRTGRTIMPLLDEHLCIGIESTGIGLLPCLETWKSQKENVLQITPVWV